MIEEIRKKIDMIDDRIIELLQKRIELVSLLKKKKIKDIKREEEILKKCKDTSIQNIYKSIFKESIKIQRKKSSIIDELK